MRLGFFPDEKQTEVLRSPAKRAILNCSRQWGKSTVTAAKAVHRAYTRAGALVLVASPSERQSAEFLRKVSGLVRRLGIRPRGDGDNAISVAFPNGSRIIGLQGNEATVRGFSAASMILIDEAARVPDEMYEALRPMLAVGNGDLWLMSTPCGQRGLRIGVKATECPRISSSFLNGERGAMTQAKVLQEYLCEFHGDGMEYFDAELIARAVDLRVPELKI